MSVTGECRCGALRCRGGAGPEPWPPTEAVWYAQRPGWVALDTGIPLQPGAGALHAGRAHNAVKD